MSVIILLFRKWLERNPFSQRGLSWQWLETMAARVTMKNEVHIMIRDDPKVPCNQWNDEEEVYVMKPLNDDSNSTFENLITRLEDKFWVGQ